MAATAIDGEDPNFYRKETHIWNIKKNNANG